MTADERDYYEDAWLRLSRKNVPPDQKLEILRANSRQRGGPPEAEIDEFVFAKLSPQERDQLSYSRRW